MKRSICLILTLTLVLSLFATSAAPSFAQSGTPVQFVNHQGQDLFLSGINLAWISFARDLSDFNEAEFIKALDDVSAAHGNAIRWWLHTDGSASPIYGADGKVTGLGPHDIENLQRALDLAYERGVLLMLCLWSHDMMKIKEGVPTDANQKMIEDPAYTKAYIDNALIPLVQAVKGHPDIVAWEIFNEPEGVTTTFNGWTDNRTDMKYIQQFVNLLAGAIHRTDPGVKVTVGSWNMQALTDINGMTNYYRDDRLIAAGGDPQGTLDFYQVHYYPEYFDESTSPFHHPFSYWQLDKPLVIGEFPAAGIKNLGNGYKPLKAYQNIVQVYKYVYENGYAGALGWTYNDSQNFGNLVDLAPALFWMYRQDPDHIAVKIGNINHLPTIVAPIGTQVLANTASPVEIANVNKVFNDQEDGTNLKYEITANTNPDKIKVEILDTGAVVATYAPDALGTANIEITATDSGGKYSKDRFVIQVINPNFGNVALGKPTTSSTTENNSYLAAYATDGIDTTRWSSEYKDGQWLQVDLGAVFNVYQVTLKWETAFGKVYDIQVWDGQAWQTIVSETNSDGQIDDFALAAPVQARYVRMHGIKRGTQWGFSLYEFQVMGEKSEQQDLPLSTNPPPVEASAEAAAQPVQQTSQLYGFESDTQGWVMADYWAGGKGVVQSADKASEGKGALKLTLSLSGTQWEEGGVYVDPAQPYDWSASKTVSADVFVPAEATNFLAQIFVKTGEGWTWANSADAPLTPGEWTTVTADLSTLGDMKDVREIGVKIGSGSTAFNGDVFIDNIVLGTAPKPAAAAVETKPQQLYGFESDTQGWVMADYWAGGKGVVQSTDKANEGKGALKLTLSLSGTQWEEGGVYVDPAQPYDWSAASTISADVFVPAEATNFLAQIFVKTGEGWTWANSADAPLTPGEWTTVTADLSTLGDMKDVREIGVKIGSGSTAFNGDVFIDNIVLGVKGEAAAAAPAVAPQQLYGFESDTQGWVMADYWAGGKGVVQSTDKASEGKGALKLTLSLSGTQWEEGGVYVDPAQPYDWSASKTVSADVFVPAEATNFLAQIFVKTGEGWTWANSADAPLTPGEWTTVTADLSTLGDMKDVREIGVKIGSGSTAFNGDVFIDNIVLDAPVQ